VIWVGFTSIFVIHYFYSNFISIAMKLLFCLCDFHHMHDVTFKHMSILIFYIQGHDLAIKNALLYTQCLYAIARLHGVTFEHMSIFKYKDI